VTPDPAVWDVLIELEQLTNPRLRDETGQISLVPPARRVSGPNASYAMAPFTHVNPKGSRFSDGTYGIYYAANRLQTAVAETVHHFARFARDSHDPPRREDMRVLVGSIANDFHDVRTYSDDQQAELLNPNSYEASRPFGREVRERGAKGILYPSVRDREGLCAAAFWPDVIGIPVQERHLKYEWDGTGVRRYFDYSTGLWVDLTATSH
jgi:hypothetical protein